MRRPTRRRRDGTERDLGGRLLGFYLRFCLATARRHVSVPPETEPFLFGLGGHRAIVGFWHECLPLIPALWWHARRRNPSLALSVLISRHRDGRMIAGIVERWGMRTVAGSTARRGGDKPDKGGASALRALLQRLADGELVAITPDGPRGPRRELQPGVLRLAAMSGVPVIAVAASCRPVRRLGSWDRMLLPLPFGRIVLHCSAPVPVPRRDWEHATAPLDAALRAVTERAGLGG